MDVNFPLYVGGFADAFRQTGENSPIYMKVGKNSPISQCIFEPLYIGENLHPFLSEHLKGQCHEILDFFSLIKPIWVPDKQAKLVFLKN